MKKIVLASAVAAVMASGVAVAETSAYGHARLALVNQAELDMDSNKLVFGFKANEDLGNGLTAYAQLEIENDNADFESGQFTNDISYVGLKGGFGAFQVGAQKDAAGFACGGTDIFTYNSGETCSAGSVNSTLNNAAVYVGGAGDLTFVLGLTFDGSEADPAQPGNHSVVAAKYAAGDLSLGFQVTSYDDIVAAALGTDSETVLGGTYSIGDIVIGLTIADNDNDGGTALAVALPLAGGSLKVGVDTSDDFNDTTNVEFKKSLSKAVYTGVQFSSQDDVDDDLVAAYLGMTF